MDKFAEYLTHYGRYRVGYNDIAITSISFCDGSDETATVSEFSELSDRAFAQLQLYFEGKLKLFDLPIELRGTPFQQNVWQQLLKIPYGTTQSYKQIAVALGNPLCSRAVGAACNRNPIAIVVPCHRVVGANGSMVGYASGLDLKSSLLMLEQSL